MSDQSNVQEAGTKIRISSIVRWVVVTAGVLLVLFTFIMAIVRKFAE
jgi:hypothetical protein